MGISLDEKENLLSIIQCDSLGNSFLNTESRFAFLTSTLYTTQN